jgi:hypothetical protein
MKFKILVAVTLCILFTRNVFAETTIKAEVDKTSITTDDTITYKLTITSTEKKIPQPQLPGFESFSVLSQSQSSTLSFAKSNVETALTYAFVLAPTDVGKFKIEPSHVKSGGKTYSTQSFEIEVTKGKSPLPPAAQPETEEPQFTL